MMLGLRTALPVGLVVLLALGAPGLAQTPPAGPPVNVEVQLGEFFIEPHGLELAPGKQVNVTVRNVGRIPHNFFLGEGGDLAKIPGPSDVETLAGGQSQTFTFTVPAEGHIVYYCAVVGHREGGMVGNLTVKGTAVEGVAGPGEAIHALTQLGVNFYAYWVGVVSFIVLFVVLAATFFLLRHGESRHWTDQRDRPAREKGKEGEPAKAPVGTWIVLGLALLVMLVAAVQVVRLV